MILPVSFTYDGEIIDRFEVKSALAEDIADTSDLMRENVGYGGIKRWCSGVLKSLNEHEDKVTLGNMIRDMPFVSAYAVASFGVAKTREDDSVESSYRCPRCGEIRVYSKTEYDDMTDHLDDLKPSVSANNLLSFSFDEPVYILEKKTGNIIEEIRSIAIHSPTLNDFIRAEQRYPEGKSRLMFFAYGCALETVNGNPVENRWRNQWGDLVFAKMPGKEINKISMEINSTQIGKDIERVCLKCHHKWTAPLNLSNFFASGLSG
jgi:hypothetical protein